MPADDSKPEASAKPKPPAFSREQDARILRGLVEDEDGLLLEMRGLGFPATAVRARASRLGLTDQVVIRCRLAGTWPSMRSCLACERRFLSTGPQRRLCKRCRQVT